MKAYTILLFGTFLFLAAPAEASLRKSAECKPAGKLCLLDSFCCSGRCDKTECAWAHPQPSAS
jgi:hypothetical protein